MTFYRRFFTSRTFHERATLNLLHNKHIMISGGAGALGAPTVQAFLAHGAKVSCADILSKKDAISQMNLDQKDLSNFNYIECDTSIPSNVSNFITKSNDLFGAIDTCCIHAGVVEVYPILEQTLSSWQHMTKVNVEGSFILAQQVAKHMVEKKTKGHLVFTSSWVGANNCPGLSSYGASKAAIESMMRSFALELSQFNIRANAIAPGIVAAGMAQREYDTNPDYRKCVDSSIPLGELQPVQSVVDTFLFMCSDACNYMTGNVVNVDGGCHMVNKHTVPLYYGSLGKKQK